jgi:hypothetical protein
VPVGSAERVADGVPSAVLVAVAVCVATSGGAWTRSTEAWADREAEIVAVAVAVADQEVDAIADSVGLSVAVTDVVEVRVGLPEFVGRGDFVEDGVARVLTVGWADGVVESDGCGELLADSDADPESEGRAVRVAVRVAVAVRVTSGDRVICRVRVALAL